MNNSKPELIVQEVVKYIETIAEIKTVKRTQPRDAEELEQYSAQQLPLCVVKTRLPETSSSITSKMNAKQSHEIDLFFYFLDNENPDATMLNLHDEIWQSFMSDAGVANKYLNGLALDVILSSDSNSRYIQPYGMFRMTVEVAYIRKFPRG